MELRTAYDANRYPTTDDLLGELVANAQASHVANQPGIRFKARWLKYAQGSLGAAFILAVAVAVAHVAAW